MKPMSKREAMLKKIATYQFAALDLQLFLDTHPNDKETLRQVQRYQQLLAPMVKEYEEKYGALTKKSEDGNNWDWIKAPWPWECEEES